jgi:tRNA pseudouridine(38-40) synthase
MRLKLTLEYAGTRYSGWQVQQNARTVQGEVEKAIREATGADRFELYGSGRTDAGVHALGQVAHLEIRRRLPPETLRRRINDALPPTSTCCASSRRRRVSTPATSGGAQLSSTRSRAAARRSPSRSCGG